MCTLYRNIFQKISTYVACELEIIIKTELTQNINNKIKNQYYSQLFYFIAIIYKKIIYSSIILYKYYLKNLQT